MKLTLTILTLTLILGTGKIMLGQENHETPRNFRLIDFYKEQIINYDTIIYDTIEFKDYRFILSSIDSVEYFSTLDNYYQDLNFRGIEMLLPDAMKYEESMLNRYDELIQYFDSSYILKLKNDIVSIPKYSPAAGEGFSGYSVKTFIGFAPELELFVFREDIYEGLRFFTVNRNTNERIYMCGFPKLSPSGKFLLSSYYDIEIGFFKNGFDLYSLETENTNLIFQYWNLDFDNIWGPEGMIWKNDSTFYMIRIMPYSESQNGQWVHRCLQKLEIKKKPAANK